MRTWIPVLLAAFMLAPGGVVSLAEERATAVGTVVDVAGKPLENATVMVYSAGVKKGYSLFCPTCYRDCGKKTVTGPGGTYAISGLDPELIFTLVAVKDGYLATHIENVDPAVGPALEARLKPQPVVKDVSQIVRGKVLDTEGKPLPGALVQPDFATYKGPDNVIQFSAPLLWINELAVTNDRGEFEIAFDRPAVEMTLRVSARAMAVKHFTVPTGGQRQTLTVVEGATIWGRLVYQGKPVAGAEVALRPHDSGVGRWYPEIRIGTAEDGTFAITNVPPGRIWLLHPTMESLASRHVGADPLVCETKGDGKKVDLGDIHLKPAHSLRGKVVLSDGKPLPPDMRVTIAGDGGSDAQVVKIGRDGGFHFDGLVDGIYTVGPAVAGYRLENDCAILCRSVEIVIHGDINEFVIKMQPDSGGATHN